MTTFGQPMSLAIKNALEVAEGLYHRVFPQRKSLTNTDFQIADDYWELAESLQREADWGSDTPRILDLKKSE